MILIIDSFRSLLNRICFAYHRLNMVVGANGTGKSTILNAICLGLGGEPKLLGRADDLRAFIMHGKDTAMIEIELAPHTNSEIKVVRRVVDVARPHFISMGRNRIYKRYGILFVIHTISKSIIYVHSCHKIKLEISPALPIKNDC